MEKTRQQLIDELNLAVQRNGNLNVLITHAIAQKIGLSATEFECLDMLQHKGPVTAGQLAEVCGLSTGGVTGLVDRLEKAGYVHRRTDAHDRRRVIIESVENPEAEQKVRQLYRPMGEAFAGLVENYTDAELTIILDFITRCTDLMDGLREKLR